MALQRELFRSVYPQAELGIWDLNNTELELLADYPLYPDLLGAYLRARIDTIGDSGIEQYISRYSSLPLAREVRYKWIRYLAREQRWDKFLEVYRAHYANTENTVLRCQAMTARLRTGDLDGFVDDTLDLWMVGKSQPKECDSAFEYLNNGGYLDSSHRRKRVDLAIRSRQFSLANFIARDMGPDIGKREQQAVATWQSLYAEPAQTIERKGDELSPEMIVFGYDRLSRRDPLSAHELWSKRNDAEKLDMAQQIEIVRGIATDAARDHLPEARDFLAGLDNHEQNELTLSWQARLAIREADWTSTLDAISQFSSQKRREEQWQYWYARAADETGNKDRSRELLADLAGERSYYGFLAADQLDLPYRYAHRAAAVDESLIEDLEQNADIVRARELFLVGLNGRGRALWSKTLDSLNPAQRMQAAIMANRWGWHSRAIATAADNGLLDDLAIRYPTPFRRFFDSYSANAQVEMTWAYGIARSESLFMTDIRSSAGALGLMQLMPATGKDTALQARVPYRGTISLLDPETNITLGTHYLGEMHDRFSNNPVLATAAYNAGPHRVDRWLPDAQPMDADMWIDSIPFRETRRYLRRVLSSQAIFYWRMHDHTQRVKTQMPPVLPAQDDNG